MHYRCRASASVDVPQRTRPRFAAHDAHPQPNTRSRDCGDWPGCTAPGSGLDVYGWIGSLATYGFIVAYALVCIALPRYLRDHGTFRQGAQIIPWMAGAAMVLALAGNLYPVPEGPYGKLPYIYLAYLAAGLLWFKLRGSTAITES